MDTKQLILSNAVKIAAERGIKDLTIDNVALSAGMSKGGVFYHFKSKEELLEAMVHHIIDQFESECEQFQRMGFDSLRANVMSAFSGSDDQSQRIMAMVAAVAHDHGLPNRTNDRFMEWIESMVCEGCTRATALLITSSIDGYFVAKAFGMGNHSSNDEELLKEKLLEVIAQDESYWYYQAFKNAVHQIEGTTPEYGCARKRNCEPQLVS